MYSCIALILRLPFDIGTHAKYLYGMGIAEKPIIEDIGFADHISERRSELVLGADISSSEDIAYLKQSGGSANPIIIEKANTKKSFWSWFK